MPAQPTEKVPSRYRYMAGVLDGLRTMGGKATVARVYDWLIDQEIAYPDDLTTLQTDGGTRFRKEVRWARKELFDAGLLSAPDKGSWMLTVSGSATYLTADAARRLVSAQASKRRRMKGELEAPDDQPNQQIVIKEKIHRREAPTTGPLPCNWSGQVVRTIWNPTFIYLARFGQRDVWKIGHASDVDARLAELNKHIPVEVLQEKWSIISVIEWSDTVSAYNAEQEILGRLHTYRTVGERVACPEESISLHWSLLRRPTSAEQ